MCTKNIWSGDETTLIVVPHGYTSHGCQAGTSMCHRDCHKYHGYSINFVDLHASSLWWSMFLCCTTVCTFPALNA